MGRRLRGRRRWRGGEGRGGVVEKIGREEGTGEVGEEETERKIGGHTLWVFREQNIIKLWRGWN